jgi:hypothetical protein
VPPPISDDEFRRLTDRVAHVDKATAKLDSRMTTMETTFRDHTNAQAERDARVREQMTQGFTEVRRDVAHVSGLLSARYAADDAKEHEQEAARKRWTKGTSIVVAGAAVVSAVAAVAKLMGWI